MVEFPSSVRSVRFGVFEVDLRSGEVRKKGVKVRLQGQPYLLLITLLRQQGEVVAREELRRTLWPEDTFVDFDHSLGTAINKLREVLGDSAANPRFVVRIDRVERPSSAMPYFPGRADFPPRRRGFGSTPTRSSRASTSAVSRCAMSSNAGSSCGT